MTNVHRKHRAWKEFGRKKSDEFSLKQRTFETKFNGRKPVSNFRKNCTF